MPIYAYICQDCNHHFDKFYRTFKEAKKYEDSCPCEKCQKNSVRSITEGLPSKFMGYFGSDGTAPSKRHSTKLVNSTGN